MAHPCVTVRPVEPVEPVEAVGPEEPVEPVRPVRPVRGVEGVMLLSMRKLEQILAEPLSSSDLHHLTFLENTL